MRKGIFIFICVVAGLYWAVHLALGSSPVQQRVLEEIRKALAQYGFNLEIESIEFSAFSPKIYLNRVTLSTTPQAEIALDVPVTVDKLKIRFSPFGLIYRQIVIEEASLYNPKVIVPRADKLYRKIERLIGEQKPIEMEGGSFKVVVHKLGVVDALFNVVSKNPQFGVRSPSLTAYLLNRTETQRNVSLQSRDIEIDRGELALKLRNIDVDVDIAPTSLRLNRAFAEAQDLFLDIRGMTTLPFHKKGPDTVNASYEVNIPLNVLNKIPELGVSGLEGLVVSSGTIQLNKGNYAGSGKVNYGNIVVDGYKIGNGEFFFDLEDKNVIAKSVHLKYGGGEIKSRRVDIRLNENLDIEGNLALDAVQLDGILASVKAKDTPVRLQIDAGLEVKGTLASPFRLESKIKGKLARFKVLDEPVRAPQSVKDIIGFEKGAIDGTLVFHPDRMEFQALLELLAGKAHTEGFVGFNNDAKIKVRTENLSLTELGHIATLRLGGDANIVSEIDVKDGKLQISGSFDIGKAEVADIVLGDVKGLAHFQNALLSFEDINMATGLESVRGSGFVDFKKHTHYKFRVEARRMETNELFGIFRKLRLGFTPPLDGEVATRLTLEGGHDDQGIDITANGQAKNFKWYQEMWTSATFDLRYRPDFIQLDKVLLLKRSGALDVKARFEDKKTSIDLLSRGLRVEELDVMGKAPLAGELVGSVHLDGVDPYPRGDGQIQLSKATFRGTALPDSLLTLRTRGEAVEITGALGGDKLRGRWTRSAKSKKQWELGLNFADFDFAPVLSFAMKRDIPTFTDVTATGEISVVGSFESWKDMKGAGTVSELNLGLKGTPMRNRQPLEISVDQGTVRVNRFNLVGRDGQLLVGLVYQPEERIRASLDGKVDLQYLQPFIPGLEFGNGKVSMGLRISGKLPEFDLLGNIVLEDGALRLEGLNDEFQNAQVQLSLSQNRISVDKFEALVNGGTLNVQGDVRVGPKRQLIPNLQLRANRVGMKLYNSLSMSYTGDFSITGNSTPYLLSGKCRIVEGRLSSFDFEPGLRSSSDPAFKFDLQCSADRNLLVTTSIMNAEFKGDFHLVGDSNDVGLLGSAEMLRGSILFRETTFSLSNGIVRFESGNRIAPRFDISGLATVKEQNAQVPQEYQVTIKVLGTPDNYKRLFTASPALSENDIISLLVLGVVTSKAQEGNYVDLGTALVGEVPIQSKLEDQLGIEIKFNPQAPTTGSSDTSTSSGSTASANATDVTVPMVEIQKQIGEKTKLSYSNSIGASTPTREVKIEHSLSNNVTINGSVVDKPRGSTDTQTSQAYGLDFRYRFQFE
ncbi:MAG: translocation/assembly module TamB domain-containing protein [Bdellovibrionota bacterium]